MKCVCVETEIRRLADIGCLSAHLKSTLMSNGSVKRPEFYLQSNRIREMNKATSRDLLYMLKQTNVSDMMAIQENVGPTFKHEKVT